MYDNEKYNDDGDVMGDAGEEDEDDNDGGGDEDDDDTLYTFLIMEGNTIM